MATGKAFGVPISSAVHKQLEARKTILKSQERTVEQTMLLHNRGAWCRMVSGVSLVLTPDTILHHAPLLCKSIVCSTVLS